MEKIKLSVKDSSLAFFSTFILCQIGIVVFACLGLIISSMLNISTETFMAFLNGAVGYLLTTMVANVIIVLCFFHFNKNKDNPIISKPKLNKILMYILLALICYPILVPIVTTVSTILNKLNFNLTNFPYTLTTPNYFISLISLVILPAVCEELLFRGLVLKGLKKCGPAISIVISAIMFSLFHMSLEQTIYPMLMGLLLGVIMYYENNIIYCIAVHLTNNFLSLTFSYFGINLFFSHWTYYLLAIILAVTFIGCVIYFIIKKLKTNKFEKFDPTEKKYLIACLSIMIVVWLVVAIIGFIKI